MKTAYLDLDGTLLDSSVRHTIVLQDVMHGLGIKKIDTSNFVEFKRNGYSTMNYLKKQLKLTTDLSEKINKLWIENIENNEYLLLDKWYSDSKVFLEYLCDRGYKRIILTARRNVKGTRNFIENSNISRLINDIVIVSPFQVAEEKSKFIVSTGKEGFYIGDTEADVDVGRSAHIKAYLMNRGFRNKHFFDVRKIVSYSEFRQIIVSAKGLI